MQISMLIFQRSEPAQKRIIMLFAGDCTLGIFIYTIVLQGYCSLGLPKIRNPE